MPLTSEQAKEYGKMGGRKGYELEDAQLKLMRKIVDTDLKLVEKIYGGKATEKDFKKLAVIQARVLKYLDKLHAGKTDVTANIAGELKIVISSESAQRYGIHPTPDTKTSRS